MTTSILIVLVLIALIAFVVRLHFKIKKVQLRIKKLECDMHQLKFRFEKLSYSDADLKFKVANIRKLMYDRPLFELNSTFRNVYDSAIKGGYGSIDDIPPAFNFSRAQMKDIQRAIDLNYPPKKSP